MLNNAHILSFWICNDKLPNDISRIFAVLHSVTTKKAEKYNKNNPRFLLLNPLIKSYPGCLISRGRGRGGPLAWAEWNKDSALVDLHQLQKKFHLTWDLTDVAMKSSPMTTSFNILSSGFPRTEQCHEWRCYNLRPHADPNHQQCQAPNKAGAIGLTFIRTFPADRQRYGRHLWHSAVTAQRE